MFKLRFILKICVDKEYIENGLKWPLMYKNDLPRKLKLDHI